MTSERRFEQDLPKLLAQLAHEATPDYRNDIVQRTAGMRQRPAWTFLERWIPMTAVSSRLAAAPRVPWRIVGLVALLLIALALSALLIAGSRRIPPPFGPAANGQVAYSANGDIYTVDPVSHVAKAVVSGPAVDVAPVWSRDGTLFAFERKTDSGSGPGWLYVARADGSGLVQVTPNSLDSLDLYAFSPDGREIAITSGVRAGNKNLWIARTDGSGIRELDVKPSLQAANYLPPNGNELIFADEASIDVGNGIYAVDVRTGVVRTIVAPTAGLGRQWITVSPDGSRIAYVTLTAAPDRNTYVVHVMAADGTGDRALPMPPRATFQDAPEWSNDSTRLAIVRGYATRNQDMAIAVVPADGSGVGVETVRGLIGCCDTAHEWAPDDRSILVTPNGLDVQAATQQLLVDPVTAATRPAPWTSTSIPAWQRVAP